VIFTTKTLFFVRYDLCVAGPKDASPSNTMCTYLDPAKNPEYSNNSNNNNHKIHTTATWSMTPHSHPLWNMQPLTTGQSPTPKTDTANIFKRNSGLKGLHSINVHLGMLT
jgi:hypothetical protein